MNLNFKREYALLRTLKHNSIARYRDFEQGGEKFIVIEFIKGVDLRILSKDAAPRKERQVERWSWKISEIMLYLHNQKVPILHQRGPRQFVTRRQRSLEAY